MRVAALDCGTNSVRLLVADIGAAGRLSDVHREMRIVRLGEGVDRTGRLAPAALDRTRAALADYAAIVTATGADRIRVVATSATRDAENRDEFVALVRSTLGVDPEVVSGDEEATLSFTGAVGSVPDLGDRSVLVLDIGGGSTELVSGRAHDPAGGLAAYSMDVGSVRMTERHFADDPPTPAQVAAAEQDIRAALADAAAHVPVASADVVVGVAGTVTTVAAMTLDLQRYDADATHGAVLSTDQLDATAATLLAMTRDQRAAVPAIHPGRVDVIAAGALILRCVLQATGTDRIVISEHDILDGIAQSLC